MIFIWDNITAVLVGGVVVLVLFTLHTEMQQTTIERTLLYRAKAHTLSFAQVVEADFEEIGFGIGPGESGITTLTNATADTLSYTSHFEFKGRDGAGNQIEIRYQTAVVDSIMQEGRWVPLLEVLRSEKQGGTWTPAGASPASLLDFDVTLLDVNNNGAPVDEARRVRVRFENVIPSSYGEENYLRRLYWGITLDPMGLSLQDYQS